MRRECVYARCVRGARAGFSLNVLSCCGMCSLAVECVLLRWIFFASRTYAIVDVCAQRERERETERERKLREGEGESGRGRMYVCGMCVECVCVCPPGGCCGLLQGGHGANAA